MLKRTAFALGVALVLATSASASTVSVIVVNQSAEDFMLRAVTKNESSTLARARKSLPNVLRPGEQAIFAVAPTLTNDVNFAAVRYQSRWRSCSFLTSYVNMRVGPQIGPKWNHSAQGGPHCSSRIVNKHPFSHDWTVEFVIR